MIQVNSKLVFDFDGVLDRLSNAVGEDALRAAGFAGAVVFRDEVILKAPKDTGFLSEQVAVIRDTSKSSGSTVQTYLIKVWTYQAKYANTRYNRRKERVSQAGVSLKTYTRTEAFYWRFFEYGTSKMAARPFIRPSYELKKTVALDTMRAKLREKVSLALGNKR